MTQPGSSKYRADLPTTSLLRSTAQRMAIRQTGNGNKLQRNKISRPVNLTSYRPPLIFVGATLKAVRSGQIKTGEGKKSKAYTPCGLWSRARTASTETTAGSVRGHFTQTNETAEWINKMRMSACNSPGEKSPQDSQVCLDCRRVCERRGCHSSSCPYEKGGECLSRDAHSKRGGGCGRCWTRGVVETG